MVLLDTNANNQSAKYIADFGCNLAIQCENNTECIEIISPKSSITKNYNRPKFHSTINVDSISNWTDADWLAKMLFTERSNPKDSIELRYIAATALNAAIFTNKTVVQVCSDKKKYSGVLRNNRNWLSEPMDIHKQVAKDMIELYMNGIPDDLKRIYAFCNMKVVYNINPKAYRWFNSLEQITTYEQDGQIHNFFACKPWDKFLANNPNAKLNVNNLKINAIH